jgi:subtilisin family serine protease
MTGRPRLPWHLVRTGFPGAWALVKARAPRFARVRIGLLDSGLQGNHPVLAGLVGPGLNLLEPGEEPLDHAGHGTAVAGVIARAARPIRPLLLPIKVLDRRVNGRVDAITRGLYWCAEQGCEVINLSFGTPSGESPALRRAVEALDRAGILLVAAAGNAGRVECPGCLPQVVAVGAVDREGNVAPFSARGSGIGLVAPGVGIRTAVLGERVGVRSGTSLAAPHVTAAAALLLAAEPHLTPAGVRTLLTESAEWLPLQPATAQGAGLLRADHLLRGHPLQR